MVSSIANQLDWTISRSLYIPSYDHGGLMMSSDAQKYYTLEFHPGLINEGLFTKTSNPNYLGEMMIYASYALMAKHWIAWLILLWVWVGYFAFNLAVKAQSLSKKPGWSNYKKQSGVLLPKIIK